MSRLKLMSWVPATKRWARVYRGKSFAVSCKQLGVPGTETASRVAANKWFEEAKAEWDRLHPVKKSEHPHQTQIDALTERIEWAQAHAPEEVKELREVAKETKETPANLDPPLPDIWKIAERVAAFKRTFGVDIPEDADPELLAQFFGDRKVWEDRRKRIPIPADGTGQTVREAADAYLKIAEKGKAGTFGNMVTHVNGFVDAVGAALQVKSITEDVWEKYFLHLQLKVSTSKLVADTASSHLSGARSFVNHLWRKKLLPDLPRNLDDSFLSFPKVAKAVHVPKLKAVQDVLAALEEKPRLKLYCLLMLNCGMTQIDIANLTPFMVDWDAGTITRRRVKTGDRKSVPTVTYPLWGETLRLLKQENSNRDDMVLTTEDGTTICERFKREVNGKMKACKKDNVALVWKRWNKGKHKVKLGELKKFTGTLLQEKPEYAQFSPLYLGHAPKTIAEKHYVNYSAVRFEDAVKWAESQILETAKAGVA